MDRIEIEKKIKYKVGDHVMDIHYNIYKITKMGIEPLYFDEKGAMTKDNTSNIVMHIAWADVDVIKPSPLRDSSMVKRLLASDLWNNTHYHAVTLEEGLHKHNVMRTLYGYR